MTETAWAHLPNAAVIDEMLADIAARPQAWTAAWAIMMKAGLVHTWEVALGKAMSIRGNLWREVPIDVRDVVAALVTWPSSADLLSLTPDALRTIIATCDGDVKHQAVLLLPAVIARSTV